MEGTCAICGAYGYVEKHHTIYRSQAVYMRTIKVNLINLCKEHHTGNTGAHLCKKTDLKLKKGLQFKLEFMFFKSHYSKNEIRDVLDCSDFDAALICKRLCMHAEGYRKEDLIQRMLGGRFYV